MNFNDLLLCLHSVEIITLLGVYARVIRILHQHTLMWGDFKKRHGLLEEEGEK